MNFPRVFLIYLNLIFKIVQEVTNTEGLYKLRMYIIKSKPKKLELSLI